MKGTRPEPVSFLGEVYVGGYRDTPYLTDASRARYGVDEIFRAGWFMRPKDWQKLQGTLPLPGGATLEMLQVHSADPAPQPNIMDNALAISLVYEDSDGRFQWRLYDAAMNEDVSARAELAAPLSCGTVITTQVYVMEPLLPVSTVYNLSSSEVSAAYEALVGVDEALEAQMARLAGL